MSEEEKPKKGKIEYIEKVNRLGRKYYTGKPLGLELRAKIAELADEGMSISEIQRTLKISHACAKNIVSKYKETGSLSPNTAKSTYNNKVGGDVKDFIIKLRSENPTLSFKELREKLKSKLTVKKLLPSVKAIKIVVREEDMKIRMMESTMVSTIPSMVQLHHRLLPIITASSPMNNNNPHSVCSIPRGPLLMNNFPHCNQVATHPYGYQMYNNRMQIMYLNQFKHFHTRYISSSINQIVSFNMNLNQNFPPVYYTGRIPSVFYPEEARMAVNSRCSNYESLTDKIINQSDSIENSAFDKQENNQAQFPPKSVQM